MKMLLEISQQSKGMKLREDNVLLLFVTRLKAMCNDMGVFLSTGTQVNDSYKDAETSDQNMLRGRLSALLLINEWVIKYSIKQGNPPSI